MKKTVHLYSDRAEVERVALLSSVLICNRYKKTGINKIDTGFFRSA